MSRPTAIDYADPAAEGRVTILHRPDGGIEVDVPPLGWARAANVRSAGTAAVAIGVAAAGMLLPAGVLEVAHLRTGNALYAAAAAGSVVVGGVIVAVVAVGLRAVATTRSTLRCTADELALERTALGQDTLRRRWSRARVAAVTVATVRTEDGKRTALHLRLVGPPGTDDLLVGRLSPGELEPIAAAVRDRLGLETVGDLEPIRITLRPGTR